jgi:hypothetical protein
MAYGLDPDDLFNPESGAGMLHTIENCSICAYTEGAVGLAVIFGPPLAGLTGSLFAIGADLLSFARASEFGIKSYASLVDALQGTGLQAHHLIEQRFAQLLGAEAGEMASIALTRAEHQAFTNAWRAAIPYGEGTANATVDQVMNAARQIYQQYPTILRALGL